MIALSRRNFLRSGAAASAWLAGAGRARAAVDETARSGMLVDLTRCIGCRACENACRVRQKREPLPASRMGYEAGEGRLSFTSWTFVDFRETGETASGGKRQWPVKKQCMHCLDPACASACPVAALYQTDRGSVVYRAERCLGCRYCMIACPFSVPRYEWNEGLTPRVGKCDFCDDRVARGMVTACAAACPTGALKFGRRPDLIREARARMKTDPRRYQSIYGDTVVGGTSWLYLSDVPVDKLGFRTDLPTHALPSLTWKALAKVPVVVVVVGLVLSGIYRLRGGRPSHE